LIKKLFLEELTPDELKCYFKSIKRRLNLKDEESGQAFDKIVLNFLKDSNQGVEETGK